jgi:hypothetical protein
VAHQVGDGDRFRLSGRRKSIMVRTAGLSMARTTAAASSTVLTNSVSRRDSGSMQ